MNLSQAHPNDPALLPELELMMVSPELICNFGVKNKQKGKDPAKESEQANNLSGMSAADAKKIKSPEQMANLELRRLEQMKAMRMARFKLEDSGPGNLTKKNLTLNLLLPIG